MAPTALPTLLVRFLSLCLALLAGGCGVNAIKEIRVQVYPVVARTRRPPTDSQKALMEESVLYVESEFLRNGMDLTADTYQPWNQTRFQNYGISPGTAVEGYVLIVPRKGWMRLTIHEPSSLWHGGFSGSPQFKAIYRNLATNLVEHFGNERTRL